jgi:hypothetical protein
MLDEIAERTYPGVEFNKYRITLINKELNSKHGHWTYPQDGSMSEIKVFNHSRKTNNIVKTCVHELAHNVEYSLFSTTGHKKSFYKIYKKLLETSIRMGIIVNDDLEHIRDIRILIKHHGPIEEEFAPEEEYKPDTYIIKINNSYILKETWSRRGYKYVPIEQSWCRELSSDEVIEEFTFVSKIVAKENLKCFKSRDFEVESKGYILAYNSYNFKDVLYGRGYIFKGYGHEKGNPWVKKIYTSELEYELGILEDMKGVIYKFIGINDKYKK